MTRIYFRKNKNVGLTVLTENDTDFCTHAMNDQDVTQYLMRIFPISPNAEREWIRSIGEHTERTVALGVAIPETDELIGTMGLHNISWVHRTATTGAWIADHNHRGKGLGTQAKLLLLHYAFYDLGLRKINSDVLATNERSRAYNEKCGYRVEGVLKEQIFKNGEYIDELLMAVFRDYFDAAWKKYMEDEE